MVRVVLKPQQGIKVGSSNKYLFDPAISQEYDDLARDWAIKTDGLVEEEDYSSKAYAIGGTGTETNNSKYYSQQAATSATNASTSETNAGISATTASTKAGEASASATVATTQAGIAVAKAGEASTSATNAGISETNAGNSATAASNSANAASASASLAHDWATSNTIVESGQYGARYYATQAYNANVTAQAAKDLAKDWATKTDGTVDGNEYSAKYYAEQAATQAIPSQTGHSGEYLTTDGSSMSWNAVDVLPSQTGQSGKFLTTDGTDASWANVDALPSQTGQSGKYLTTDGTNPSWNTITIPSVDIDGKSITRNTDDELQTIGVINQNDTTTALKVWSGDEADLPAIKDANTFYATEETVSVSLLDVLYPVGSIYITTNAACPLSTLIAGSTWVLVSSGRVLQGADSGHSAGTTIEAGLPNITGQYSQNYDWCSVYSGTNSGARFRGAFTKAPTISTNEYKNDYRTGGSGYDLAIDASLSNSIYGNSTTVQPPAYVVNIYRRTA